MDVVLWFLGGFAGSLALIWLWNAAGRKAEALWTQPARVNAPKSAAVEDLAERLNKLERTVAAMDLKVLDTAEKVAHRLQDRERKRTRAQEEIGEVDDPPNDPGLLLARARAAYPLPGLANAPSVHDAQMHLGVE